MPKYSANLASPFTIGQLADQYKTAFDTLGWGTGKVSIQGGYRFTAQQATDTEASPIAVRPDGSVTAPSSVTNVTAVDWVDNLAGKAYVYPTQDGRHRWPLLFYLPGLKAFRITFTPVYRADGATTGAFTDIEMHVVEGAVSTNPSQITSSTRAASLKDPAWGSSYTVGQSYTTLWSHPDALSGVAEVATHALIYAKNVILRIDQIEYIVTPDAFGVQGPNLDGPLFEFRFLDGAGYAHGYMRPLPIQDAYRPRVLLLPPYLNYESSVPSSTSYWRPTQLFGHLFNAFRDDGLQQIGVVNEHLPTYAVVKHYSYGADLSVLLASNGDHRGFFLRSAQAGSSTIHIHADRVDKSVFPAAPTTIPERRERARWLEADASNVTSLTRAPQHVGLLFKVEGQNRKLTQARLDLVYGSYSNTYTFRLYKVSLTNGDLVYEQKVADVPMVGDGSSSSGSLLAEDLNLDLAPGYYLLVPPTNVKTQSYRGVPTVRSPIGTGARMLGPVVCRDLSDDTAWVQGSTVLNVTGADFTIAPNNAAVHMSLSLWLEFEVGDTPTSGTSAFGEGLMMVTRSPGDSSPNPQLYEVAPTESTENSSNGKWAYGACLPLGVDVALASVEAGQVWQLSPLPGWFSGTRKRYTTAKSAPTLEFEPDVQGRFPAWMDRPYRFSLPLERTVMRPTKDVAAGNSYANSDGSEDLVTFISRADGNSPWSVCFHTEP